MPCKKESEEFLAITEEYCLPFWNVWATYCCALTGDNTPEQAGLKVKQSREQLQSMGVRLALSSMMVAEAQILLSRNKPSKAQALIEEAKIYIEETGERYYESEIIRLEGEVHCATGQKQSAETCYRKALDIATAPRRLYLRRIGTNQGLNIGW